jgi:DNA-binding response OmpR family regulator
MADEMSKILIVDENDAARNFLRHRLEGTHDIADTGNTEDALAMALNFKPDCVLLDLMMPSPAGLGLCQSLKSLSYTRSIPIFVITGEPAAKHKAFCTGLGAQECFANPLNIGQLTERLAATLKSKVPQRRRGARVQLRVCLKLRGVDVNGTGFELLTTTEDVSVNGFYRVLDARLHKGDTVEVFLETGGERSVGRARVVRTACQTTSADHYGFEFTEKFGDRILGVNPTVRKRCTFQQAIQFDALPCKSALRADVS